MRHFKYGEGEFKFVGSTEYRKTLASEGIEHVSRVLPQGSIHLDEFERLIDSHVEVELVQEYGDAGLEPLKCVDKIIRRIEPDVLIKIKNHAKKE